ncbi:unnamed protein product, partial [Rhizoctonia solani]
MFKWLLATYYLYSVAVALTNHGAHANHHKLKPRTPLPEKGIIFDQVETSITTRTARLRATLPVFQFVHGRSSEYELGRALDEYMLVKGRPISTMAYSVEPDLAMFAWLGYDKSRRVLSGTPPIAQPPVVPFNAPSYLDVYIYIGTDRSHRLRTVLGIIVRDRGDTMTPASTPTALVSINEQV